VHFQAELAQLLKKGKERLAIEKARRQVASDLALRMVARRKHPFRRKILLSGR